MKTLTKQELNEQHIAFRRGFIEADTLVDQFGVTGVLKQVSLIGKSNLMETYLDDCYAEGVLFYGLRTVGLDKDDGLPFQRFVAKEQFKMGFMARLKARVALERPYSCFSYENDDGAV